jgi:hypothetical protein
MGLGGVVYAGIVVRRRQEAYRPVFEDWLFHIVLPLVAYATLAGSSLAAPSHVRGAVFGVAAASLLLLFVGMHNTWDAAAYHMRFTGRARDPTRVELRSRKRRPTSAALLKRTPRGLRLQHPLPVPGLASRPTRRGFESPDQAVFRVDDLTDVAETALGQDPF